MASSSSLNLLLLIALLSLTLAAPLPRRHHPAASQPRSTARRSLHSSITLPRRVVHQQVEAAVRPPADQPLQSVWWAAADTTTYNPVVGGGRWSERVSSLVKRDQRNLRCGDLASFMIRIETSSSVDGPISSTNIVHFDGDSTGQSGIAFEYIDSATLSVNDPETVLSTTMPTVTLEQALVGTLYETARGAKAYTVATVKVTNLQPGDVAVVRINARIGCLEGASPTGVLQAKLESALGSGVEVDRKLVHGGTIPLKLLSDADEEGPGPDDEGPNKDDYCPCDFFGTERNAICLGFAGPIPDADDQVLCAPKACVLKPGLHCVDGGSKVCTTKTVTKDVLKFLRIDPVTGDQICEYKKDSGEVVVEI